MSGLTRMLAVLVLGLWGLAGVHCRLEVLTGWQFLDSCCATDSAPFTGKDCSQDGCDSVEKGGYRAGDQMLSAPEPLRVELAVDPVVDPVTDQPNLLSSARFLAPPELPRGWQFASRAAVLPRAPSVAS